jgi:hypothetical protein
MGRGYAWKWFHYYWNLCKEVGMETYKSWRWELFSSILLGFFVAELNGNWKDFRTALVATAMTLGCFVAWHAIRAPWLLHKSTQTMDSGPGTVAGILGIAVIAAVLVGGIELGRVWWRTKPLGTIDGVPAPPAPQITLENPSVVTRVLPAPDAPLHMSLAEYKLQGQTTVKGNQQSVFVLIGLTNKVQQQIDLKVSCRQDIEAISTLDFGRSGGLSMGSGWLPIDSKSVLVKIGLSPPWNPESPFLLTVATAGERLECGVARN